VEDDKTMSSVVLPSVKTKKSAYSMTRNLYWGTMFTRFLYQSILSTVSSFMKIDLAIQLSGRTSNNNFNQILFSSSEAETCRWTDV
jgi:hypothetical protein